MKKQRSRSFRKRLFHAFLLVSLVPMLLCAMLLLQIVRMRVEQNALQEAEHSLSNVVHAMDEMVESVTDAADHLSKNPVIIQALEKHTFNMDVYNKLFEASAQLRCRARFDLYDTQGKRLYATQKQAAADTVNTQWGALRAAGEQAGTLAFVANEYSNLADKPLLQGAIVVQKDTKPVGYLVISLDRSDFQQLLDNTYGAQNEIMIVSQYWHPVYCSQSAMAEKLAAALREKVLTNAAADEKSDFLYRVVQQKSTGLYFVLQQPQVFSQSTLQLVYTASFAIALACIAISVFMSFKLSKQMFRPIQEMQSAIREVEKNNLDVQVGNIREDELGHLAQQFNEMVVALKHNQQQLVENQTALNEAQIRMLQAQLNPHFLCNTLDTMKWISKINRVPQVAVMATNLADILRVCISPEQFVPLYKEVDLLHHYIEIQEIRLSNTLKVEIDIPEELRPCIVPKMMLQPIVENAILHGLEGVENGCICVRAQRNEENLLCVTVSDNGKGFPDKMLGKYVVEKEKAERPRRHLGLYNVDTILQKNYGAQFGLYLANAPDGNGAVVTAILPITGKGEEQC